MSTIYYIASRVSTTVEKTACAVSASLLVILIYNGILDLIYQTSSLKAFRIEYILTGGSTHQVALPQSKIWRPSLFLEHYRMRFHHTIHIRRGEWARCLGKILESHSLHLFER